MPDNTRWMTLTLLDAPLPPLWSFLKLNSNLSKMHASTVIGYTDGHAIDSLRSSKPNPSLHSLIYFTRSFCISHLTPWQPWIRTTSAFTSCVLNGNHYTPYQRIFPIHWNTWLLRVNYHTRKCLSPTWNLTLSLRKILHKTWLQPLTRRTSPNFWHSCKWQWYPTDSQEVKDEWWV